MQVKITGKNLDIGAALRAHIENRIFDIAEKYFNGSVSAHVTLEKQRSQFTSDCTLHLATGLVLQAHGQGVEAMPSYDKAASHLEKQLRRYKRRLKDHNDSRVEPVRRRAAVDYIIASAGEYDAEEPKDLNPEVPKVLSDFVMNCLLYDPMGRPNNMRAVAEHLEQVAKELGVAKT